MLLLLVLCVSANLHAQKITISGYVTEKQGGETIPGAIVYVPGTSIGASVNTFGFYSITVPAADTIRLHAAYLGYTSRELRLVLKKDTTISFALEPAGMMKDVVVAGKKDAVQHRTLMSSIDLPIQTIKSLPAFLGEVDIMKAIQLLPGIQAGNEGSTGIYVRGGSPDQNLILLDGVPVYNSSHLFGFFSVFNADAIKSVEVIKGGFPARYGGRLSSVIDVNMKEGNKEKIHGEGGIGLIASRLTLEGPIQKGKSSFMVSGRRTYYDVLAQPFMKANMKAGYFFSDFNAKANFKLSRKDRLYVSGYFGNDKFYSKQKTNADGAALASTASTNLKWGNITAVGRWNHEFNNKLFGNVTAYYSQYNFSIFSRMQSTFSGASEDFLLKYSSGIHDRALKWDLDYLPSANHTIKTGVGYIYHTYKPGAMQTRIASSTQIQDTTVGTSNLNAGEVDAYVEDDIKVTDKLKINIGIHATGFAVSGQVFPSVQPRLGARYLLNDKVSLKASFVQMNQFIHLLSNSSIGLPTDLWVPVTRKIPVQKSYQGAAGVAYTLTEGLEVTVEGYYKTVENVIEYKEGASFFTSATNWEEKVEVGNGKSYGAEFFLQKKQGKVTGMLGYTLSKTTRQFDNLNQGKEFPYKFDRRHDLKIACVFAPTEKFEISADWVYGTGNALTLPLGYYYNPDNTLQQINSGRNTYRMPAYHRADISMKFTQQKKRGERAWIVSAYNVYNRKNPYYVYSSTNSSGNVVFKQMSLFPIIPSVSYQFKF
jgi:outer membrane receptor for ferrienterochelin and colicin